MNEGESWAFHASRQLVCLLASDIQRSDTVPVVFPKARGVWYIIHLEIGSTAMQRCPRAPAGATFVKSIFFVSTVTEHLELEEVRTIANQAAANNRRAGITGFLAFNGFNFLQLTEGGNLAVEECLRRISGNTCHSGMITFREEKIIARQCRNWRFIDIRESGTLGPPLLENKTASIISQFYKMAA